MSTSRCFSNGVEVKAVRFEVDTDAGSLTTSRPGGVLWPKVSGAYLRVIARLHRCLHSHAREAIKSKLKMGWGPSNADTSHANLISSGGRNYASNAYGMQRKDWAA